jgi:hypothetical protein
MAHGRSYTKILVKEFFIALMYKRRQNKMKEKLANPTRHRSIFFFLFISFPFIRA